LKRQQENSVIERSSVKNPDLSHTTISGVPVQEVYTAEDVAARRGNHEIGLPGEFPYTRGIHKTMYRGRHWTMRQFAGFGTPEQTNERFHLLLEKGQTGLSTAFDLPTLMGLDSDDPKSDGEVGRLGVAMDTVDDMLALFEGINLEQISVSMTINAPAAILMAFYVAAAQEKGFELSKLRGTIQNDILKEFHAQNEFVYPPEPSVSLVIDLVEFCAEQIPQWNTISISGYHIREAGSTAAQELAFTLADGRHYAEQALRRDLDVDQFAPRFSFFFNAHNDMFEEVAKYRAAREIWARIMRDDFGAKDPKSWMMRFHAQTAGCSLQDKQPEVNLMRVSYQAMAAVLGGCQSLHTNCMDETLALPTEHAVTLALRTQQVLAHETGVVNTVDPLGGSYFVETMTSEMVQEAEHYFNMIAERGGMMDAIESGFFRREIADSAYQYQCAVDNGAKKIVGVTDFVQEETNQIDLLTIDSDVQNRQIESLHRIKKSRSADGAQRALDGLRKSAAAGKNMMEPLVEAARARVTVGEMVAAMGDIYGSQTMTQL
jgi:methylmalonyl-CoA mutase N-terminal domain/subunit